MKNIKNSFRFATLFLIVSLSGKAQQTTTDLLGSILGEAANSYKWNFAISAPKPSNELKFSDATISLEFAPMDEKELTGPYNWAFWITNNTGASISINWENSYVTSLTGKQRAVYHSDMKSTSSAPQKNTLIAAKQKVGDAVIPKESVVTTHHEGHWDDYGKWVEPWNEITSYQMFFGDDFPADRTYETVKPACEGKTFKMHLALVVGGAPKNYDFTFKVAGIDKSTSTESNPLTDALNQNK